MAATLRSGSRGTAVTDLQKRLAAAGFNPGPIDGIFGSKTAAAVKAYQKSKGLAVDGVVGPQTWGALTGSGAAKPASKTSSKKGGSSKPTGDDIIERMLKSEFGPLIKPFVSSPELRKLIVNLAPVAWGGKGWTEEKFLAAVRGTKWWGQKSENTLSWKTLTPGEKESRIKEIGAQMFDYVQQNAGQDWTVKNGYTDMYKRIGSSAGKNYLRSAAYYVASGQLSFEQWQVNMTQRLLKDSTSELSIRDMQRREEVARLAKRPEEMGEEIWQQAHGEYFINLSKKAAKTWADNIINGKSSFGELKDYLRGEAAKMYKGYEQAINNGVLPKELFGPALGVLSNELEMSEEQVVADSKLWGEITAQAAGNKGHFTASDWVRYARANPAWKATRGAREMSAGFGERLLRQFGAVA